MGILRLSNIDLYHIGETLLTGDLSFGAMLEEEGFNADPSPRQPAPGGKIFAFNVTRKSYLIVTGTDRYLSGGYVTKTYGSRDTMGPFDAIQIETPVEVNDEKHAVAFAISPIYHYYSSSGVVILQVINKMTLSIYEVHNMSCVRNNQMSKTPPYKFL